MRYISFTPLSMKRAPYIVSALFLTAAVFFMPLSFANAQIPFGGLVTVMYSGVCTASVPSAQPFVLIGVPAGFYMYIPGSIIFPKGPPSAGKFILGLAAGFVPCLMYVVCGIAVCVVPFPAHPGGLLVILSGTS